MVKASQVKATTNFIKNHTKRYVLQCHNDKDADVIEYLSNIDNVNGFLKQVIRSEIIKKDMK